VRLLLDTHIWIWSLTDPGRLAPHVVSALSDAEAELWLSAISVWEALVLIRKRRLRVAGTDGPTWVSEALKRAPLREAPITYAVALESERLSFDHWDPADRFIAATARVLEATLVTADERLIEAKDLNVLANR
jgi:PIN domain nuclease of toxin-antitoxin system